MGNAALLRAGRRFPLAVKLAAIACVFAVPIAIMLALLWRESGRDLHAAAAERRGVEYLRPLVRLLHAVQSHNVATAAATGSEATAQARATDEAVAQMRLAETRLGAALGTAERSQNLADHWGSLRKRQGSLAPERSLMEHRALSDGIVDTMYFVAERSGLLLDPEARSAYLQDAAAGRMPELISSMGQASAVMRAGDRDGVRIAMAHALATKALDSANRSFVNAFGGSDVAIDDPAFPAARAAFEKSSSAFLEATGARLRADAAAQASLGTLGTRAMDDALALELAAIDMLDRAIAARAAREGRVRVAVLAGVIACVLVAVLLTAWLSRDITRSTGEATRLAAAISGGDLTRRIRRTTRDEIGDLMDSLNQMSERVTQLVAQVKHASDDVSATTADLTAANGDLADRTERQASSLEEMAASSEELAAAVRQGAGKIAEAGALVEGAARRTADSNADMVAAVARMREVEASSRRIADITGVIDGISFQTNILALNAAVEAARVGVEGRGFAVVAGEIRLLSQRSAAAAREIKTLIAETVAGIAQGGDMVEGAGESLAGTVDGIGSAVAIMADMTAMARQQSESIAQISAAVAEVNGATQQNAALVQRNADRAHEQQACADRLVASVGEFRLAAAHAAGKTAGGTESWPALPVLSA